MMGRLTSEQHFTIFLSSHSEASSLGDSDYRLWLIMPRCLYDHVALWR